MVRAFCICDWGSEGERIIKANNLPIVLFSRKKLQFDQKEKKNGAKSNFFRDTSIQTQIYILNSLYNILFKMILIF